MLQKQIIIFIVFMLGLVILAACGGQTATVPPASESEVASSGPEVIPTATAVAPTSKPSETPTDQATARPIPQPSATPLPEPTATPEIPACDGILTPAQAEGPYYTPNTPERASLLEPEMGGTPLLVVGRVFDQNCEPIAGVKLDFWQTDAQGRYDNDGYRLRGHQFTDETGAYALETVLPGEYPGRTPHIHVKVFAPGDKEWLTTQIYLPGISDQITDGIYRADLLAENLEPAETGQQRVGFNFILTN